MRKVAVVYNPISGGARGEAVSIDAERAFTAAGWAVEREPTTDRRGATPIAGALGEQHEAGDVLDRLVVVGGDGTLREAIDGLGEVAEGIPIAVIPMGNANIVARELGIPREPEAAIETAVEGQPVEMDVGTVEGDDFRETFLGVVGVGWDAHTVRMLDAIRHTELGGALYRTWADGLYGLTGFAAALRPRSERFSLEVDGEELGKSFCAAWLCNLRTYGKGMAVTPDAHRSSGLIHIQARVRGGLPFLFMQLGAATRSARPPEYVSMFAEGTRAVLEGPEPFAVQVDGDDRGWTRRLVVAIRPAAVRLIAPSD